MILLLDLKAATRHGRSKDSSVHISTCARYLICSSVEVVALV